MATQTQQQRRTVAHSRPQVAAAAAAVVVAAISGALILSTLVQPASQASWKLTNTAVTVERPAGVGFTPFAGPAERMSAAQVADRYGVETGFLESTGDGSFDLAAGRARTQAQYGLKTGFLEIDGAGAAPVAQPNLPHGL